MKKERVSIYIDKVLWAGVKNEAWRSRLSASKWVEEILRDHVSLELEMAIDVGQAKKVIKSQKDEMELLRAKNEELMKKRKEAETFVPYSKNRQIGKGKK